MPKVSVIIPVYNVERYLRECLDSVTNQTLTDIEIICVNDCSPDNSLHILQDYAQKDGRIKIINLEKNVGQGIARNIAIEKVLGEYIQFLDADDWLNVNAFEKLYNYAKKMNVDYVEYTYNKYFEDTGEIRYRALKIDMPENQCFSYSFSEKYLFHNPMFVTNKFYNANFIKQNNIKFGGHKLGEDHIFNIHTRILGSKAAFIDAPVYNYRIRQDSACHSVNPETLKLIDVMSIVRDLLCKYNLIEAELDNYNNYVVNICVLNYLRTPKYLRKEYDNRVKVFLGDLLYKEYKRRFYKRHSKFYKFTQKIFSVKNKNKYKVITVFGIKIKLKRELNHEN